MAEQEKTVVVEEQVKPDEPAIEDEPTAEWQQGEQTGSIQTTEVQGIRSWLNELDTKITTLTKRFDALVEAIDKSKSVNRSTGRNRDASAFRNLEEKVNILTKRFNYLFSAEFLNAVDRSKKVRI